MHSTFYFPNEHPLKKEIREGRIKLWHLRNLTGVSESKLSRHLNGIDPMPIKLEQHIKRILKLIDN